MPIEALKPGDVPFSELTSAELDWLVDSPVFSSLDPGFRTSAAFRRILQMHGRVVECKEGDIVVREGDWGNSAFFVLSGAAAVGVEAPGKFLSDEELGRRKPQPKNLFQAVAQWWRNAREPEYRDTSRYVRREGWSRTRDDGVQMYFQDVPRLLRNYRIVRLEQGELFGEQAALGRTARAATVFAATEGTVLLEVRWQGLRDLMRKDAGLRQKIDQTFRDRALEAFLRAAPQLQHLVVNDEVVRELVARAQLATYGTYDQVASFKDLAQDGIASNLASEELIAKEGDYPNGVIIIRSGVARVSRQHHHGHRTVSYLTPGKMYGFEEIHEGRRSGKAVPLRFSLRAIGYLTAVVLPTPLVEQHLLAANEPPPNAPPPPRARKQAAGDLSVIDPDTLEFLVQNRFVNGTATMLINLDRCTGCDDCVRACASTHDNNPRFLRQGPVHGNLMVAHACMHCQDPTCMIECPTGAISRRVHEGEVSINDTTCIGCGTCSRNCPYDAIRMVEIRDENGMFIRATKSQTPITKATKCDLCVDQLGGPACQRACPHDALARMDMSDVESLAARLQR